MPTKLYEAGARWTGNAKGRPPDFRIPFTKDIFKLYRQDTEDILQIVIDEAKQRKQWALKLYVSSVLPYFLVKPKTEMDIMADSSSDFIDKIKNLPVERLVAIQQMIAKEMEH